MNGAVCPVLQLPSRTESRRLAPGNFRLPAEHASRFGYADSSNEALKTTLDLGSRVGTSHKIDDRGQ